MVAETIMASISALGAWVYHKADPLNLSRVKTVIKKTKEKITTTNQRHITITIEDGIVTNVKGMPKNYTYEIDDKDIYKVEPDWLDSLSQLANLNINRIRKLKRG